MIVSLDMIERSNYFLDLLMVDYVQVLSFNRLSMSDWDSRYTYFDVVIRNLYYEDDDFHLFVRVACRTDLHESFVKMSKKCLKNC